MCKPTYVYCNVLPVKSIIKVLKKSTNQFWLVNLLWPFTYFKHIKNNYIFDRTKAILNCGLIHTLKDIFKWSPKSSFIWHYVLVMQQNYFC